jgi:hypothetical protein
MAFVDRGYASDSGFVCLIRQSTAEAAASGAAGGTVDAPFHCLASGSRRRFGIHPRGARLSRVVGAAPNEFTKSTFVGFPTAAAWEALNVGADLAVGGVTWKIAAKVPESSV